MRLLISLLLLAATPPQERTAMPPASAPGTYEILICKGPCTFTSANNVLVRGSLILEAQSFQPPDLGPGDFMLRNGLPANACFVLETLERSKTYAGIVPIGFPNWSQIADTVAFRLYGSPDAGHQASVILTEEGFRGTGTSRGGGAGAPPASWTPDVVVGRRIGPADRSICTRAIEGSSRR